MHKLEQYACHFIQRLQTHTCSRFTCVYKITKFPTNSSRYPHTSLIQALLLQVLSPPLTHSYLPLLEFKSNQTSLAPCHSELSCFTAHLSFTAYPVCLCVCMIALSVSFSSSFSGSPFFLAASVCETVRAAWQLATTLLGDTHGQA